MDIYLRALLSSFIAPMELSQGLLSFKFLGREDILPLTPKGLRRSEPRMDTPARGGTRTTSSF